MPNTNQNTNHASTNTNSNSNEIDQQRLVLTVYQLMSQIAFTKLDKPNPFDNQEYKSSIVIKHSIDYILSVNELLLESASNISDKLFSNQDILAICSYMNILRGVIFSTTANYFTKVKALMSTLSRTMSQTHNLNIKLVSIIHSLQSNIVELCKEQSLNLEVERESRPLHEHNQHIARQVRPGFSPRDYFNNNPSQFRIA